MSAIPFKFRILSGLTLLLTCLFLSSCHVGRYLWWNFADIRDGERFPSLPVASGDEMQPLIDGSNNLTFEVPEKFNPESKWKDFDHFLERHHTVAFIVMRDDTVLYEKYFHGFDDSTQLPSFSISKVMVSALTGIAIDEGFICSTEQPITFFMTGLRPEFDIITIEDLLNMRSGIRFSENYWNPFAGIAKYYYGTNLLRYSRRLKIRHAPDQEYDYIGVNTFLLGQVIEQATSQNLSSYLEQKIWIPLGMESGASWSIDHPRNQNIKSFCCINAVARDFARFGRLYLNKGNWDGNQIISEDWVTASTSIMNDSRDSQGYPYTYHWRVLENGAFFAKGILGQYLYVYPEKKLVFVRLGKKYAGIDWAEFFGELATEL
jgi:CubicO group peptidase (beta-lactamase class C family)